MFVNCLLTNVKTVKYLQKKVASNYVNRDVLLAISDLIFLTPFIKLSLASLHQLNEFIFDGTTRAAQ
jgi:hypothetical protein